MPLDPEMSQAIAEAIKEQIPQIIGEVIKPFTEQIERQQRDYKKLNETISNTSQFVSTQDEKLNKLLSSLEKLEENKQQQPKETEETQPKGRKRKQPVQEELDLGDVSKPEIDVESLRASLMAEMKQQYESKVNQIQQQLEERDKETQALREADRRTRLRNDVLASMRSLNAIRPNTEEDLLTLLEKRNLLLEDGDKLYIKSQDRFGDPVKSEVKDVLPKMLESDFAHFAVPRGGTGTSATPSKPTLASQYNFKNMSAQQIYDNYANDPAANQALIEALEQQYGKSK
jgi:hypothetical protein